MGLTREQIEKILKPRGILCETCRINIKTYDELILHIKQKGHEDYIPFSIGNLTYKSQSDSTSFNSL